jgi:hypothetical protein
MKSRRRALRFSCNHRVRYKTAYDEGEAILINVSTGGCAFQQLSLPLHLQDKILVSITMPGCVTPVFEAQGIVVRVDDDCTAIHFSLVEPDDQIHMRNYFSKQMRKSRK